MSMLIGKEKGEETIMPSLTIFSRPILTEFGGGHGRFTPWIRYGDIVENIVISLNPNLY